MKKRLLLDLVFVLVTSVLVVMHASAAEVTIWQIGTFNYSRSELADSGLTGVDTFDFYVGTMTAGQFPGTLYLSYPSPYDYRGVHRVNIHFTLASPYMDVNFVYGRGGDEVDHITLDGVYLAEIAGIENSWEGSPYTIPIGPLGPGAHVISIEVTGNDTLDDAHVVDALKLTGHPVTEVEIDIKPGSYPNCFNVNGHGVIPVAILGSDTFDVTQIDVETLNFGGLEVRVKGNGTPQCSVQDVSGDFTYPEGASDGYDDLVCQFVDDATSWLPDNSTATLTGNLFDGTPFMGSDEICIVP